LSEKKPRYGKIVEGAEQLSLGVSIVVAILLGIAIGIGLKKLFGIYWLFWLGVFWGVSAAGLNIYRAYKRQKDEFDKLKDDPRYKDYSKVDDSEFEDEY
jgi:F0F1-type ATP synthase assembly protein I